MLDAVKVAESVRKKRKEKKSSLLVYKSDILSSPSVCPPSPTDICTVWQSIISPRLQKQPCSIIAREAAKTHNCI